MLEIESPTLSSRATTFGSHLAPYDWWKVVAVLAVMTAVLFLRRPEPFLNPQFYADDANFFVYAREYGLASFLVPYMTYLALPIQAVALVAAQLPVMWAPSIFNAVALALMLYSGVRLMSPRLDLVSGPARYALPLLLVLVPHNGEVFVALCCAHFVLGPPLIALLFMREPETRAERFGDAALLVLGGSFGPFIAIVLPLFIWRAWQRRTRFSVMLAASAFVFAVLNAVAYLLVPELPTGSVSPVFPLEAAKAFGAKFFAITFTGGDPFVESRAARAAIALALTAAFALAVAPVLKERPTRERATILLLVLAGLVALALARVADRPAGLVPFKNGDRYAYIPRVLIGWLLVLSLVQARRWLLVAVASLFVFASARTFRTTPLPDYGWHSIAPLIEAGEHPAFLVPFDFPVNYRRTPLGSEPLPPSVVPDHEEHQPDQP